MNDDRGRPWSERTDRSETRLRSMERTDLVDLVADLWESSGWDVESGVDGDGTLLATRESTSGDERLLIRVFAGEVGAPAVRATVATARDNDADGVVAVSNVGFAESAVAVSDAYGVDLVGPTALVRSVDDHGVTLEARDR